MQSLRAHINWNVTDLDLLRLYFTSRYDFENQKTLLDLIEEDNHKSLKIALTIIPKHHINPSALLAEAFLLNNTKCIKIICRKIKISKQILISLAKNSKISSRLFEIIQKVTKVKINKLSLAKKTILFSGDNQLEKLQYFIKNGKLNIDKRKLIIHSIRYRNREATKYLLSLRADPNEVDKQGRSALFYAPEQPRQLEILLQHGADPNKQDVERSTPLIAIVKYFGTTTTYRNYQKIKISVKRLIQYGADPTVKDHKGLTALDYSLKYRLIELATIIKKSGGKARSINYIQSTPPLLRPTRIYNHVRTVLMVQGEERKLALSRISPL